ncbi:MAG: metallophosphoesterase [Clostridiales bacterium]|jgi:rubrerythrin|nr:metallophosphoesterase [Clostridiales bacterium]
MMKHVDTEGIQMERIGSFTVIGDPGCDGLGVEIMSVFNAALHGAAGDFALVLGDIVPNGARRFYEAVTAMVDSAKDKPIYMLCGNHDTDDYEAFFGRKDYYLYDDRLLLIVLDNSKRVFSDAALALLSRALERCARENIVIAMHIPPPNRVINNSVGEDEWAKLRSLIAPYKTKIRYILCGHVHSYFEDEVDGIKLVATGGGGARIEFVDGVETPDHHLVEFAFNRGGELLYEKKDVVFCRPRRGETARPSTPDAVQTALREAFANESMAHVRYRLFAEHAARRNKSGLARLFLAASDSEFYHARNHFFAMEDGLADLGEALAESLENETYEVEKLYREDAALARSANHGLAAYAFEDAREAEKVHQRLFQAAQKVYGDNGGDGAGDIPELSYFTCTSCGYTFAGDAAIKFCPVCGAPFDKIKELNTAGLSPL